MTVTSSLREVSYNTDGSSTDFAIPYYFLSDSHISVEKIDATGTVTPLIRGTDFDVSGEGNENGGTLHTTTTYPSGSRLRIFRVVPATQETEYQQNDPFPAKATERALDKLTMLAQQNAAGVANSIRYPDAETDVDGTLPPTGARVNTVLAFDSKGRQLLLPMPTSIGAGDLRFELGSDGTPGFKAGVDFTPDVLTTFTLSRPPGNRANVWLYFDATEQFDFTLDGNELQTVVPAGIDVVNIRIGTTLSLNTPAQNSVGDQELAWGDTLTRVVNTLVDLKALDSSRYTRVRTLGRNAIGDGGHGEYFLDAGNIFTLATPSNITATPYGFGGVLPAGVKSYRLTSIDESGETLASVAVTAFTTGTNGLVMLNWAAVPGAAAYRIYGREAGIEQFLMQVDTLTWMDDGGIPPLGFVPAAPWKWDNGGTRVTANDGGRYRLVHEGAVAAEQFGAFPDDVTDNQIALQAAILAMFAQGGGRVVFRANKGKSYLTRPLKLLTNVTLQGIAMDFTGHNFGDTPGSSIKLFPNTNDNLLFLPLLQHGVRLIDLQIDGNKSQNPTGLDAVHAQTCGTNNIPYYGQDSYLLIERCHITKAKGNNVSFGPGQRAMRIVNCYVTQADGDNLQIFTSDCTIEKTLIALAGAANINLVGAEVTHFTNCDVFTAGTANVQTQDSHFFSGPVPTRTAYFVNCEFDQAASHGVLISDASQDIRFEACRFNGNGTASPGVASNVCIASTVADNEVTLINCSMGDWLHSPPTPSYGIPILGSARVIYDNCRPVVAGVDSVNGLTNAPSQLVTAPVRLVATQSTGTAPHTIGNVTAVENSPLLDLIGGSVASVSFHTVNAGGYSPQAAAAFFGKNSGTNRSINAGGTINASGADYAEYEFKRDDCGEIAKGQVVGFDANGLLTDRFSLSVRFGIKSTAPNLVGGDVWHSSVGDEPLPPARPLRPIAPSPRDSSNFSEKMTAYQSAMAEWSSAQDAYEAALAAYETQRAEWTERVDTVRSRVDRIAYCGKVPVNVLGARPGQHVVPIAGENDCIALALVNDDAGFSFDQYRHSVGRVNRLLEDGRAEVTVRVA
ncbi:right-handed parallel beta-helix repeat-containing protein [Burkholderia vietnamiensis]|uniref:right-handed parallel beta-helix repeat-containing protein n=1 Tax=Burkholderia vietnamiensis TaxID=60552 RepID=UPI0009C17434|nr:right-handed parallel beta-helix repeat-containing protein [Burkholderia vietnamiensis]